MPDRHATAAVSRAGMKLKEFRDEKLFEGQNVTNVFNNNLKIDYCPDTDV